MEYAVTKDSALGPGGSWISFRAFTTSGFQNWRKAHESFKAHHVSAAHTYSMQAWCEFKQRKQDGSRITKMLGEGHLKLVRENRDDMKAVVESLRYTACQGIAQRGHREDDQADNKANFLELLNVIAMFDKNVAKKTTKPVERKIYPP